MPYRIQLSPAAKEHLQALRKRQQVTIVDSVEKQLAHEPSAETKNRKLMRPNPLAPWELRIGTIRVYYDVDEDAKVVLIVAIGIKVRNRVFIESEEVDL